MVKVNKCCWEVSDIRVNGELHRAGSHGYSQGNAQVSSGSHVIKPSLSWLKQEVLQTAEYGSYARAASFCSPCLKQSFHLSSSDAILAMAAPCTFSAYASTIPPKPATKCQLVFLCGAS